MVDDSDGGAVAGEQPWGEVGRSVIDDDDFAIETVVGFGQQGIEALAGDGGLVVDRNNDRR